MTAPITSQGLSLKESYTFDELQSHPCIATHFSVPIEPADYLKWFADLIEHKKKIGRQVRKAEVFATNRLITLFLMLVGFSNYRSINLQTALTTYYPGWCLYCAKKKCKCGAPGATRPFSRNFIGANPNPLISVSEFQRQDWKVYGNDREREAKLLRAMHASEEGDEFIIELLRDSDIQKVIEELADFIERLISIASTFKIDIGKEVALRINALHAT